ncbi:MAG: OmpA family protein [Bacteroidetes bacterium]|jgi:chemotaxis protein MotB|nr:OmpA family protein [Bacteroidota bacterium]
MKTQYLLLFITIGLLGACVPKKDLVDLQTRYDNLQSQNDLLTKKLEACEKSKSQLTSDYEKSQNRLEALQKDYEALSEDYNEQTSKLQNLEASYNALEQNSSELLQANAQRNRDLLKQLEDKEKALAEEQKRLEQLQKDLDKRSYRIEQLENLIASKDAKLNNLKNKLSEALVDFEGRGLSVEQRDGKVYVSMENKLLFASGSWNVGREGQKAISELANVLAQNPDISVLIEGHTDNVPYGGNGPLKDNWDLSTKRATEVLKLLLKNNSINPQNLTAAGRGKFAPVASNTTKSGRAKNRRIEVVLEPQLDQINKLLEE